MVYEVNQSKETDLLWSFCHCSTLRYHDYAKGATRQRGRGIILSMREESQSVDSLMSDLVSIFPAQTTNFILTPNEEKCCFCKNAYLFNFFFFLHSISFGHTFSAPRNLIFCWITVIVTKRPHSTKKLSDRLVGTIQSVLILILN